TRGACRAARSLLHRLGLSLALCRRSERLHAGLAHLFVEIGGHLGRRLERSEQGLRAGRRRARHLTDRAVQARLDAADPGLRDLDELLVRIRRDLADVANIGNRQRNLRLEAVGLQLLQRGYVIGAEHGLRLAGTVGGGGTDCREVERGNASRMLETLGGEGVNGIHARLVGGKEFGGRGFRFHLGTPELTVRASPPAWRLSARTHTAATQYAPK